MQCLGQVLLFWCKNIFVCFKVNDLQNNSPKKWGRRYSRRMLGQIAMQVKDINYNSEFDLVTIQQIHGYISYHNI